MEKQKKESSDIDDVLAESSSKPDEPAPSEQKITTVEQPKPSEHGKSNKVTANLAITISILVLASSVAIGFFLWQELENTSEELTLQTTNLLNKLQQQNNQQVAISQNLKNQQQAIDFTSSSSQAINDSLLKKIAELKQHQQALKESLEAVQTKTVARDRDVSLTEVETLLKIAGRHAALGRESNAAIAALVEADNILRDSGDTSLIAVRAKLAQELELLRNTKRPDSEGIIVTLDSIATTVTTLPLRQSIPQQQEKTSANPKSKETNKEVVKKQHDEEVFDKVLNKMWGDIRGLVRVRQIDSPVVPFIKPEERFILEQNLRLKLEQARIALFDNNDNLFHTSLNSAILWIENYFDSSSKPVARTIDQLNSINRINISFTPPQIGETLTALKEKLQNEATAN